jgi:hypothetical protein
LERFVLPLYLYAGHVLLSTIVLPELPLASTDEGEFFFQQELSGNDSNEHVWNHQWLGPRGEKLISYGRQQSFHWLSFPGLVDFKINADGKEITCYRMPEFRVETIRHLLLDQVLPRCLAYQGKIMIHASAVRHNQGLILFIGDSGSGKSTLAGNFHQAGTPVMSDDCLWIKEDDDRITAVPTYGGLRLWEDSLDHLFPSGQNTLPMAHYSSKRRVSIQEDTGPVTSDGLPVLAVMMLASARSIGMELLSPREAFIAVLKQTFQLDLHDLERVKAQTQALGRIVPRLRVYRLSMPRNYALLPLVRQRILETVT